jgi:hypothetical protein
MFVGREKRLGRRERGAFYRRGQVLSGSLARFGTRARALDAGLSQQEYALLVLRQPTRDLGTS